ncbi:MAG: rRNA pseudouridine synthase [Candidatus Latescibacteria bacterium]|nr:rRNA pseudouridine synthase [Candidatus Latescibacterota bacterium]
MRLNLFLARAGAGSRREADGWIREGRVRVNGLPPAGMGPSVDPLRDRITLDGKLLVWKKEHRYLAYHKPAGILVSRRSQGGHPTVFQALGDRVRGLHAVGRLDLPTEGLLLFTDDGALAEALLHPRTALSRLYRVWVAPVPAAQAMRTLRGGAVIEGVEILPRRVILEGQERGLGRLLIEILEGKKREVRLLARAAGLHVERMLRIQFGPIRLGALAPGAVRPLTQGEVRSLRRSAGIPDAFPGPMGGDTLRPATRSRRRGR